MTTTTTKPDATKSPPAEVIVYIDNVSKSFGQFQAIRAINLKIHRGEIFGFLGPNGAGKSTTIRMILDILRPTSGVITLFGIDSRAIRATHRRLGYLSGDMVLDGTLTGHQYLTFVAAQYGKDCQLECHRLADLLQANLRTKMSDYSRGNRQKIGLIAALQHQPELLIMDEPTSGFDPLIQEQFAALILAFKAKGGTALLSSHILTEVQQLCDRVAFIKGGQILQVTTVAELTVKAAKQISIKVRSDQLAALRRQLTSLRHVQFQPAGTDIELTFTYGGDIMPLIQLLAAHQLQDVTIQEPDLETIFRHYYEAEPQDIANATVQATKPVV